MVDRRYHQRHLCLFLQPWLWLWTPGHAGHQPVACCLHRYWKRQYWDNIIFPLCASLYAEGRDSEGRDSRARDISSRTALSGDWCIEMELFCAPLFMLSIVLKRFLIHLVKQNEMCIYRASRSQSNNSMIICWASFSQSDNSMIICWTSWSQQQYEWSQIYIYIYLMSVCDCSMAQWAMIYHSQKAFCFGVTDLVHKFSESICVGVTDTHAQDTNFASKFRMRARSRSRSRCSPGGGWKGAGCKNYYWKGRGGKGSKGGGCNTGNFTRDKGGCKAHKGDASKGDKGSCKNSSKGSNHSCDPTMRILENLSHVLAKHSPNRFWL